MSSIEAELIKAASENQLTAYLAKVENESFDDVVETLIDVNNKGKLNLVEDMLELDASMGYQFFWVCHIFENALPKTHSDELKTIKCILHLLEQAGEDLAAGQIVNAYEAYCSVDVDKAKSLLRFILADTSLTSLLAPTLVSGSKLDCDYFWNQSSNLLGHNHSEVRAHAIRALGRLSHEEESDLTLKSFEIIEQHIEYEKDDSCLANLIDALPHLSKCEAVSDTRTTAALKQALMLRGEQTLHAAAVLINYHHQMLSLDSTLLLLDSLRSIPSKNKGTLAHVDFGLSKIICDSRFYDESVSLLEVLISNADENFSFNKSFKHTSRALLDDSGDFLTKLITKWFLTANIRYCSSIQQIISSGSYRNNYLVKTIDTNDLDEADFVFLARKAIGYLFIYPVTAVSYIFALLTKSSSDEVKVKLKSLVYETLQLNFPGMVGDFLKAQAHPKEVKAACEQILDWSADYFEAIRNMEQLPELSPSQAQHEAYARNFSFKMRESMKSAESESPLLSLVSKSIILYGRKSIDYIQDGEGAARRSENHLQRHETGVEVPRQSILDPVGLDYSLRVFRTENKVS